jgi:signal transduction histidine kinase
VSPRGHCSKLSDAVAAVSREGLSSGGPARRRPRSQLPQRRSHDEFGRLTAAFARLLATLRSKWDRRSRRSTISVAKGSANLSHDLRSPMTPRGLPRDARNPRCDRRRIGRAADRELVGVALRNTRNAGRLVQSLGDLVAARRAELQAAQTKCSTRASCSTTSRWRFEQRAAKTGIVLRTETFGHRRAARGRARH